MSWGFRWSTSFPRSRRPNQSSSWRSASHARVPCEPSTSMRNAFLRPKLTCESTHDPRAPPSNRVEDVCDVLGGHRRVHALDVRGARERLDLADRTPTHGDRRREVGEDLGDARARHELREVHPVRADVADRAKVAAALRREPPVPVLGRREPVLQVPAGGTFHTSPELARDDPLARLLDNRIEADVEVRAVHEPLALFGQLQRAPPTARTSSPRASRRRRACPLRAPASPARSGGRSAWSGGRRRRHGRRGARRSPRTRGRSPSPPRARGSSRRRPRPRRRSAATRRRAPRR